MSYFSLEDICATQERVSCHVSPDCEPIPGLAFLDPASLAQAKESDEEGDLRVAPLLPDAKMELPLWLAQTLTGRAKQAQKVKVSFPPIYSLSRRVGQVSADPVALDLSRIAPPHFYDTGRHLLKYSALEDRREDAEVSEDERLGPILVSMLTRRFRYILDGSFNSDEKETPVMTSKLDHLERSLYEHGQKSQKQLRSWFRRQTDQIVTAELVSRHNKRKAAMMTK